MKTLAFLLALLTSCAFAQDPAQEDPNLKQYQNLTLGLKFQYPKAWEIVTNKKGESKFLVPLAGTSDRAVIEVFSVSFRSETSVWQLSQVGMSKAMKREVEKQWEEEILGVPLLLTQAKFSEQGSERKSVTGLVYSLGFNKLMYRVTAPPSEFDSVDYAWRQVLQSLRTWNGELPVVEDMRKIERTTPVPGGAGTPAGAKKDDLPHPQIQHEISGLPKAKPVKSPVAATATVGEVKLNLMVPADWKVEAGTDGTFLLSHPNLAGKVTLRLQSEVSTEAPAYALLRMSGQSLAEFSKVEKREDTLPKLNNAGASVAQILRMGSGAKGSLMTLEASGQSADVYFLMSYRSEDATRFVAERRLLENLLDKMSVEPAS